MGNKRELLNVSRLLLFLVMIFWFDRLDAQSYSGGAGTSGDPYWIGTLSDLQYLSTHSGDWSKYFKQTANIDASATSGWNSGQGFIPIGNLTKLFSGGYNGQGYTISNLYINRPLTSFVGLFGATLFGITISRVGLLNVNVTGAGNVGAVAGYGASLDRCFATGSVSGSAESIGGLIGYTSYCNKSYSSCTVTGKYYVGGLAGTVESGTINNCYARGNIEGAEDSQFIGGLVGWNSFSAIGWCYSTGLISGSSDIGGLIGFSTFGTADNCFWDIESSGQTTSAGGTGKMTAEMKRAGTYLSDPSLTAPWDFTLAGDLWTLNSDFNNGYPILRLEGHPPGYIWLGTISIAWSNTGNWSEAALPGSGNKVYIPNVTNDPVLSTVAETGALKVEAGGNLSVTSSGRLTVHGGSLVIEKE